MRARLFCGLVFVAGTATAQDLSAFGITAGAVSGQPQVVLYRTGTELALTLPVGDTRLVHFPTDVRLILPTGRPPGLVETLSAATVYWTAEQPFTGLAVTAEPLDGSEPLHLRVSAEAGGSSEPLHIRRPDIEPVSVTSAETLSPAPPPPTASPAATTPPPAPALGYVEMLRFAAQSLYAPSRLRPPETAMFSIGIAREPWPLIRNGVATAVTHARWQSGELWLTAVVLTNQLNRSLALDPTAPVPPGAAALKDADIRGDWRVYGFQHPVLGPKGSATDQTTMYLIHRAKR